METIKTVRSRLRFDSLQHVTTPDGSGRVSVRLEWGGENYEGTVDEVLPDKGLVRVLVTIFGRQAPIELEYWQINKAAE